MLFCSSSTVLICVSPASFWQPWWSREQLCVCDYVCICSHHDAEEVWEGNRLAGHWRTMPLALLVPAAVLELSLQNCLALEWPCCLSSLPCPADVPWKGLEMGKDLLIVWYQVCPSFQWARQNEPLSGCGHGFFPAKTTLMAVAWMVLEQTAQKPSTPLSLYPRHVVKNVSELNFHIFCALLP